MTGDHRSGAVLGDRCPPEWGEERSPILGDAGRLVFPTGVATTRVVEVDPQRCAKCNPGPQNGGGDGDGRAPEGGWGLGVTFLLTYTCDMAGRAS